MFLAKMEKILQLYALEYNPDFPVVCFDERPCFLIGDRVEPIAMQTGVVAKEHYSYSKNGSCSLLAMIEPLSGKRCAQVYDQRTKKEYTLFMQEIAKAYPTAHKIRVVQDNLNTHNTGSFYEHLPAEQALALAERFEFYYTPNSSSWLNMIEIEFSALTKQCLNRRIPNKEKLAQEIVAIIKRRNDKAIKIEWQFSIKTARTKMATKYQKVNPDNRTSDKT
ncbi:MAG TPA: IS630 family transposase [Cyclobacteriaceae bacterium]|nr:IS630 family transposase [Cyclobacteriaceae bacterium]